MSLINLKDKVCLITGGTRGIGKAIVEYMAELEGRVAFTYSSSSAAAESLKTEIEDKGGEALHFRADASEQESAENVIKEVIDAWGKIDVLVNNAGITRDNLLLRMKEEQWDEVLEVNLKSVFNYSKAVSKPMMRNRGGSVINISSVVGLSGNAGQSNYAASKAGMIGFSKSMAKEFASRNIRVNVIAPGYINTDMTGQLDEKVLNTIKDETPMGRPGEVDEVAHAVGFLASDLSSYITGEVIRIDGGMAM